MHAAAATQHDSNPAANPAPAAVPRVLGLLMVVLAFVGLMQSVGGLRSAPDFEASLLLGPRVSSWETFGLWANLTGLAVGALHLGAGVAAARYHRWTVLLATIYAGATILRIGVLVTVYYTSTALALRPLARTALFGGHGAGLILHSLLLLGWAALVVVLLSLRPARRACSG